MGSVWIKFRFLCLQGTRAIPLRPTFLYYYFFIDCFIIPEYSLGTHHTCILWMLFRRKLWVPPLHNHCQIVVPARARLWFSCGQVWMHTSHGCSNNSWKSTSQNGSALSSSELSLTMSQMHSCFPKNFFFLFSFQLSGPLKGLANKLVKYWLFFFNPCYSWWVIQALAMGAWRRAQKDIVYLLGPLVVWGVLVQWVPFCQVQNYYLLCEKEALMEETMCPVPLSGPEQEVWFHSGYRCQIYLESSHAAHLFFFCGRFFLVFLVSCSNKRGCLAALEKLVFPREDTDSRLGCHLLSRMQWR